MFPCNRDKSPVGRLAPNGRNDATTNENQIRAWWGRGEDHGIGLATGVESGLYVIDEDADNAATWLNLPPTRGARTGKGRHLYFLRPEGGKWGNFNSTILGAKVDAKGDGGYVVAPPSLHANGKRYTWDDESIEITELPTMVRGLIEAKAREDEERVARAKAERERRAREKTEAATPSRRYGERALEGECEAVINTGEGGRNNQLNISAMRMGQLVASGHIDRSTVEGALELAALATGLELKEIANTIRSGIEKGLTEPRIVEEKPRKERAREERAGEEPSNNNGPPPLSPYEQAVADLTAIGFGTKGTPVAFAKFESTVGLFDEVFPDTPWQVRGLITERSLCVIGGEPKTTKTWAALEIAMAIATGTPAFGEFQAMKAPAHVALFMAEDSRRSVRNRLRALATSRGLEPKVACARMHAAYMQAIDLRNINHVAGLVVSVREIPGPVGMIVLDPLRDCHGAEENSATEMATVAQAMRALRTVTGASVVFIHHMGKATADSKNRRAGQSMRGSTALHGAVDCGLYLRDLKTDKQTVWTNKAEVEIKGARGAGDFSLTWHVKDINDEAVAGHWTFDRDEQEAKQAAVAVEDAELVSKLVDFLRGSVTADGAGYKPVDQAFIRVSLAVKKDRLAAAVEAAIKDGSIARAFQGAKPNGLIYLEKYDEEMRTHDVDPENDDDMAF